MSDVFFLGAGFSKAVNKCMPSMKELSIEVARRLGADLPPPLAGIGEHIELWLTYLSQPQPWLKEYSILENRALFLKMTEIVHQVIDETTRTCVAGERPAWLAELLLRWIASKTHVVTLNYDTLIERAAVEHASETSDLYSVPLLDIRRGAVMDGGYAAQTSGPKLHKLHGSVNWFYSGAASFQGEELYCGIVTPWKRGFEDEEGFSLMLAQDKVPLIAPPTTEKSAYFQHEVFRLVWRKSSEALRTATRIYCIGYSLHFSDLGIRFFLLYSKPNNRVPLVVINPDESVVGRYRELFGGSYEVGEYQGSIEDLANDRSI